MKYYQMKEQNPSFAVWISYEQCIVDNNCNKEDIRGYELGDIEAPRFMDLEDIASHDEIAIYLKREIMKDKVDLIRSFLSINNKEFKDGMEEILGYVCTDADSEQFVKQVSENVFFVVEKDHFHTISIPDYTEAELEEEVSSYYSEGIAQIKREYGSKWKQIVAEIIAENK